MYLKDKFEIDIETFNTPVENKDPITIDIEALNTPETVSVWATLELMNQQAIDDIVKSVSHAELYQRKYVQSIYNSGENCKYKSSYLKPYKNVGALKPTYLKNMPPPLEDLEVLDILVMARAYVGNNWCQGAWFRDAQGEKTSAHNAHSVCMLGAVRLAAGNKFHADCSLIRELYQAINSPLAINHPTLMSDAITDFNDNKHTTLPDVLKVFDHAISSVSARVN